MNTFIKSVQSERIIKKIFKAKHQPESRIYSSLDGTVLLLRASEGGCMETDMFTSERA